MSAPYFTVLTQKELTIDLSREAMQIILRCVQWLPDLPMHIPSAAVHCELDNFVNTLQNLIERSEPKPENFDLIGG